MLDGSFGVGIRRFNKESQRPDSQENLLNCRTVGPGILKCDCRWPEWLVADDRFGLSNEVNKFRAMASIVFAECCSRRVFDITKSPIASIA